MSWFAAGRQTLTRYVVAKYQQGDATLHSDVETRVGAYGLAYGGVQFPDRFIPPPSYWRRWDVEFEISDARPHAVWSPDLAVFPMRPVGAVVIDRVAAHTKWILPAPPEFEAFAHPFLGLTAVAVAGWEGAPNFHAGAFVYRGRAWLVAGDSGAGKSSMLAWFATHEISVLADDLSVVRNGQVLAGPRCIDLRESAARHFGIGEDVGIIGTRRRWRVPLPQVPAEVPVAGWIRPRWSDRVELRSLSAEERLQTMATMRGFDLQAPDPTSALQLLALPALDFARPRNWSAADAAMTALLARLSA